MPKLEFVVRKYDMKIEKYQESEPANGSTQKRNNAIQNNTTSKRKHKGGYPLPSPYKV